MLSAVVKMGAVAVVLSPMVAESTILAGKGAFLLEAFNQEGMVALFFPQLRHQHQEIMRHYHGYGEICQGYYWRRVSPHHYHMQHQSGPVLLGNWPSGRPW